MTYASSLHGKSSSNEARYLNGWRRTQAELENLKKRLHKEQTDYQLRARAAAVASLLDLADNFQAIVKHIPPDFAQHNWTKGVEHVARQFQNILSEYGVSQIAEVQVPFNPNLHEAIGKVQKSSLQAGLVLEVVQPGYVLGSNVLRPAKVKITA